MERRAERSRYFQEIAQTFFDCRGAPFVLSSQDVVTIAVWEETGVPLRIVLDGIQRAFENWRKRQVRGRKISSLSFCHNEVMRAFAEFRDRRVGRERPEVSREKKRKKATAAVRKFLTSLSAETDFLRSVYQEAVRALSGKTVDEEALERLDARIEEVLADKASEEERAEVEARVRADFGLRSSREVEEICAVRLVKLLREKHKIPYLSLFYY